MSRFSAPLTPLLLPFGHVDHDRTSSAAAPPGRPLGVPPRMPSLIHTRAVAIHYDLAHADRDGRLAIRKAALLLAWPPDARLAATYRDLCIVIVRSPVGDIKLRNSARLRLPVALRRRAGLVDGAPALLAADLASNELIIYPAAAIDAMIAAWRSNTTGGAS